MCQGLLDLERLCWNLRRFRTGHRKDQTQYGLHDLDVPDLSFWGGIVSSGIPWS
jgi:hypothetical protein